MFNMRRREFMALLGGVAAWPCRARAQQIDTGVPRPLVVSSSNPRYFANVNGEVIYFRGSHTWTNLQEWSTAWPITTFFDFTAYINYMQLVGSNFMRMWMMEQPAHIINEPQTIYFDPLPWSRPGPGTAADGRPKFDLGTFNQTYFDRMRARCIAAGAKGIYVSIMMFDGVSLMAGTPNAWTYHPFNVNNNINGINGDPSNTGVGWDTRSLSLPDVIALQRLYIDKLIDTVNDLDNILYEISNEDVEAAVPWQYDVISYIRSYELTKAKRHPVWMTTPVSPKGVLYSDLTNSAANAVSPAINSTPGSWNDNITESTGAKVVILDQDHIASTPPQNSDLWTWKGFLRGNNVIHMDNLAGLNITGSYLADPTVNAGNLPYAKPMRRAMRQTGSYAARCNLNTTVPKSALSSTGYCIATPGTQYLVLQPSSSRSSFTVNLSAGRGKMFSVEWLNVRNDNVSYGSPVAGGSAAQSFTVPFSGAAALFLNAVMQTGTPL
jgi:hypothetical protein